MSSFRRMKPDAALVQRLYSLPRRELQALCKQHGIPANKTNVKMADALSACVSFDSTKAKASVGLGISKSTPMKLKLENKTRLPETSLAAFILSGKKEASPVKLAFTIAEREEANFPKPNTTPLKRGVKRTERPLQTVPEEKPNIPVVTRASAFQLGRTAGNSPKPRAPTPKKPVAETTAVVTTRSREARPPLPVSPTPRKRAAEAAAIVTTRSSEALQPVPFSDLLTTPKKSGLQVSEIIELDSSGITAKKMKSRLGPRTGPEKDEATPSLPNTGAANKVSKGKTVSFADKVDFEKDGARKRISQLEPDTETAEISYTEIEFKDAALHKELLGVQKVDAMADEQQVASTLEDLKYRVEDILESRQQPGFEYRDVDLHKELFGLQQNRKLEPEECLQISHDVQQTGSIANASESATVEHNFPNSPLHTSDEVQTDDSASLAEDPLFASDCLEEAQENSGLKKRESEEDTVPHLVQGHDADDVSRNDLTENSFEESIVVPEHGRAISPAICRPRNQSDSGSTFKQELSVSSSEDVHLDIEHQERELEDIIRQPSHQVGEPSDDTTDNPLGKDHHEEKQVESISEHDEAYELPVSSTLIPNEVRMSSEELVGEEKAKPLLTVSSTEGANATGARLVKSDESNSENPVTPLTRIQNNIDVTLAKANSILERLASWRASAEKKKAHNYWEPKFSSVMEDASTAAEVEMPIAKTVSVLERDLPSAKKVRAPTKVIAGPEKELAVCEDSDLSARSEIPSAKKMRVSEESKDFSEVSDKENYSDKSMEDRKPRKFGGQGKDKKNKRFEVLKDRSKNVSDHMSHESVLGTIKECTAETRFEDMSLRKLRAQVKEKTKQLETSKVPDVRSQRNRNMSH